MGVLSKFFLMPSKARQLAERVFRSPNCGPPIGDFNFAAAAPRLPRRDLAVPDEISDLLGQLDAERQRINGELAAMDRQIAERAQAAQDAVYDGYRCARDARTRIREAGSRPVVVIANGPNQRVGPREISRVSRIGTAAQLRTDGVERAHIATADGLVDAVQKNLPTGRHGGGMHVRAVLASPAALVPADRGPTRP